MILDVAIEARAVCGMRSSTAIHVHQTREQKNVSFLSPAKIVHAAVAVRREKRELKNHSVRIWQGPDAIEK